MDDYEQLMNLHKLEKTFASCQAEFEKLQQSYIQNDADIPIFTSKLIPVAEKTIRTATKMLVHIRKSVSEDDGLRENDEE